MNTQYENDALRTIQTEIDRLRKFGHKGWCTKCRSEEWIIRTDVATCETECDKCYAKRRYTDLTSDESLKEERLKNVKSYFQRREDASRLQQV